MNLAKLMDDPTSATELEAELQEICRTIESRIHPLAIYLFGSTADKTRHMGSDIDLAILVLDKCNIKYERRLLYQGTPLSSLSIDVLLWCPLPWHVQCNRNKCGAWYSQRLLER